MRVAEETLRAGGQLLIFPEGTRRSGPEITGTFEGVGYIAARTGTPIVPVGIAGTEQAMGVGRRLPRRVNVAVVACTPIYPPANPQGRVSRLELKSFSETVVRSLQEAFDEARVLAQGRNPPTDGLCTRLVFWLRAGIRRLMDCVRGSCSGSGPESAD